VTRKHVVNKNDIVTLHIEDLTSDGNGVGKIDGYPLFIPHVIPGETAEVKVVKVNKRFGFGKLLTIFEKSEHRVEPDHQCSGCKMQHISYSLELDMKYNQVKNVLNKVAHLKDINVHPVIGMDNPWRYRNKVQMPIGERGGRLITGFYRERSHDIVESKEPCNIQHEMIDELVDRTLQVMNNHGIKAYDEKRHQGDLRHIVIRIAEATNEAMIILVTRTKTLKHKNKIVEQLKQQFPHVTSIVQNINSKRTNVILGNETNILWGESYIYDEIGDLTFAISPRSFYQVNAKQTRVLYEKALAYADISEDDIVIDAYCGIGTISLFLAQKAKHVYGVEIVEEAIADAQLNARLNKLDNATFVQGAAEDVMPKWTKESIQPNVIVVDPPRKGCDESLLHEMVKMNPERIVYVSCNPATLARDLAILADEGYETKEIQPVDMFPQTTHVECVSLLQRETI